MIGCRKSQEWCAKKSVLVGNGLKLINRDGEDARAGGNFRIKENLSTFSRANIDCVTRVVSKEAHKLKRKENNEKTSLIKLLVSDWLRVTQN